MIHRLNSVGVAIPLVIWWGVNVNAAGTGLLSSPHPATLIGKFLGICAGTALAVAYPSLFDWISEGIQSLRQRFGIWDSAAAQIALSMVPFVCVFMAAGLLALSALVWLPGLRLPFDLAMHVLFGAIMHVAILATFDSRPPTKRDKRRSRLALAFKPSQVLES